MKELRKTIQAITNYYKYGIEALDASDIRRLDATILNLKAGALTLLVAVMLYILILHT